MSDVASSATVDALQATLAPYAATVGKAPRSTIIPPHATPDTAQRRALANLGQVHADALAAGVTLEGTLGRGGMGIVHLGTQRSLGRKVAVKSLRDEHAGEAAVLALLQEAWVTGTLEHPNVLPVYDIEPDLHGRPLVVLKRIEGVAWSELLDDPARIEREHHETPLVWNLGVFLQVGNALRYAHERGILHRDLKPDNVMIGAYGEVYLLDWGIAVSLHGDDEGRLPSLGDANAVAGTPAYMAPEMMSGDGRQLGIHTDVYLLGAVLFEVLVGRPPHEVTSLGELVRSATSPARIPDDVPREIADVVRRAMDPDPAARFPDVQALLDAVQAFLRHRGSAELAARTDRSRRALLEQLEAGPASHDESSHARIYELLAECRFGYREARTSWPDNPGAIEGWQQAALAVIEYELDHGDAGAAAVLAAELPDLPDDVRKRVDAAVAEAEAQRAELEAHRKRARQFDRRIGSRTRTGLTMMFGAFFVGLPVYGHFNDGLYEREGFMVAFPAAMLAMTILLWWWARESLMKTIINRRLMASVAVMFAIEALVAVAFALLGVPVLVEEVVHVVIAVLMAALLAIHTDRWFSLPAVGYAIALLACGVWPQLRFLFFAAGNVVLTVTLVWAWRPRTEAERRISAS